MQMPDTKKGKRRRSVYHNPGFAILGWESTGSIGTDSPLEGISRNHHEIPFSIINRNYSFAKSSLGRSCVSVGSFIQDQYLGIM